MLRGLVGGRDADAVAGDLRETFAERGGGRLWYWRQVLSCAAVRFSLHRRALPGIGADFGSALRRIRRNPGYAVTAMFCLALALGVNTTLFTLLDSMIFRRLPVPEADRILQVGRDDSNFCRFGGFLGFRDSLRSMQAAAVVGYADSMEVDRAGFGIVIESVSANYPQVLRLGTAAGAWFHPDANADPEVVISYRLWRTRFRGDPSVVGKHVRLLMRNCRIAGVAPREFTGTFSPLMVDVWIPLVYSQRRVNLIARLADGATLAGATAEMDLVNARLRAADPGDEMLAGAVRVRPAAGFLEPGRGGFLPIAKLLCAVSAIVLLIACVNVANLLLSRAAVRQREMAIRQSLGASRARLFRETVAEGLVLAAGGLVVGVLFGYATGRALEWALPSVPSVRYQGIRLGIDWRVALFLAAAGIVCAILFSLPPAIAGSWRDPGVAMRGDNARRSRQRESYSAAQVALSLALLIATGLLLRALDRVRHIDAGFAADHRAYVNLRARGTTYTPKALGAVYDRLLEQARELPGVEDATLAWEVFPNVGFYCAAPSREGAREVRTNTVDPNYFELMGIPIVRGSGFPRAELAPAIPYVIVNQTMARTFWPGQDAIGKTLWIGCQGSIPRQAAVIGIARDAKYSALGEEPSPLYYLARRQDPENGFYALLVRTSGDPRQWTRPLVDLVRRGGGELRIYDSGTLEDSVALSLWDLRWQASLLGGMGLLAIILAAIGVYGVVACSISQRTREIGMRMALGAAPLDVQWMVLAHGLRVTAVGIASGLLLSAATVRLLRRFLYGLSPFDLVPFAAASIVWIAIAMLASWCPARRATRVDPMTALNYE